RRDAEGAREARCCANRGLYRLGDEARSEEVVRHLTDIEISLVEAGLLHRRDDAANRLPDVPGILAIERVARANENGLRAAAQCLGGAHRGVDAEASCDVVGGGDHAATARVATDDE